MAIDALNTAANGLLQSERRANDIAQRIVAESARGVSFDAGSADAGETGGGSGNDAGPALTGAPVGAGATSLISDIVGLQSEQRAFEANANVFRRADALQDELGRLLDEDG